VSVTEQNVVFNDPRSEVVEREFDYGTIRFENLAPGDWRTKSGSLARSWRRRYLLNEREVVSPSQLVGNLDKPALVRWIERESVRGAVYAERTGELEGVPEEDWTKRVFSLRMGASAKRDEGAMRGTAVHEALHQLATTGSAPNPADVADFARPWLAGAVKAWETLKVEEVVEAEQIVGHPELLIAGRFDLLARCDGGHLTLIDWKTSPKGEVYAESHWQAAAYKLAIERSLGVEVDRVVLIGVGPSGQPEVINGEITVTDLRSLLDVHHARKRVEAAQSLQRKLQKAGN
jgi:hypothetical protein